MRDFTNSRMQHSVYPYLYERGEAIRAFKDHQLTIEHDDGVFRSLYFGRPGTGNYHFRLTTWPGHLAISGDIGDYIFSRVRDMFEFFAHSDDWASMPLKVNPAYWLEKAEAVSKRSQSQYQEVDEAEVKRWCVEWFRALDGEWEQRPETTFTFTGIKDDRVRTYRGEAFREMRRAVLEDLPYGSWNAEEELRHRLMDFDLPGYYFRDDLHRKFDATEIWEAPLTRSKFGHTYLMCCYAIVWGIKRYAQAKEGRDTAGHMARVLAGEL